MRTTWLLLALAACGDDGNHKIADAAPGPQDTMKLIDAPPSGTPVTVTVADAAANTRAYFLNADSTVVKMTTVDASGNAMAVMDAGGFVAIVEPEGTPPTSFTVTSWAGVKPGDHLLLHRASQVVGGIEMTITLPVDTTHGVANYQISSTCGGGSIAQPTTAVTTVTGQLFFNDCTSADVMVTGLDSNTRPVVAFYVGDQALADAGAIDYTAKTYAVTPARRYELDNNPDPATPISLNDSYTTAKGPLFDVNGVLTLTGNPATASMPMPALPAGATDVIAIQESTAVNLRQFAVWGPTAGPYVVDWAAHLLPSFIPATPPTYDVASRTISWTATPGGVAADYSGGGLSATRGTTRWTWQAFGPSATSVVLPTLPTDLADLNVAATDTSSVSFIGIVSSPGGWDAARANIQQGPPTPSGASGQIVVGVYTGAVPTLQRRAARAW